MYVKLNDGAHRHGRGRFETAKVAHFGRCAAAPIAHRAMAARNLFLDA